MIKKILGILSALALTLAAHAQSSVFTNNKGNYIENGDFEKGQSTWIAWAGAPCAGEYSIEDVSPISGTKSAKIQITAKGTYNWHYQFEEFLTVQKDVEIKIKFKIKASKPTTFDYEFCQNYGAFTPLVRTTVSVGTDVLNYEKTITPTESDGNFKFCFLLGNVDPVTFWIDDISITQTAKEWDGCVTANPEFDEWVDKGVTDANNIARFPGYTVHRTLDVSDLDFNIDSSSVLSGKKSAHFKLNKTGVSWYDAVMYSWHQLRVPGIYELSFQAVAAAPTTLDVSVNDFGSPANLVASQQVSIGTEQRTIKLLTNQIERNTEYRSVFAFGTNSPCEFWLDNIRMKRINDLAVIQLKSFDIQASKQIVPGGKSINLKAINMLPEDASFPEVVWSITSDATGITLTDQGVLSVAAGSTLKEITIKATAKDKPVVIKNTMNNGVWTEREVTIAVVDKILLDQIVIQGDSYISTGTNSAYTTTGLPENADNFEASWSVENLTGEATISESGVLSATKTGTVNVIATAKDGSGKTDKKMVTVVAEKLVSKITISGADTIRVGRKGQLVTVIAPKDADSKDVTWSVTNGAFGTEGQATIDQTGEITGVIAGKVKVKATAKDLNAITAEKVVVVLPVVLIDSIYIYVDNDILMPGQTSSVVAKVFPKDADNPKCNLFVQNVSGMASLSSGGTFFASYPGEVTIVAKSTDGSDVVAKRTISIVSETTKLKAAQNESSIYPNPTSGMVYLNNNSAERYSVWDTNGNSLLTGKLSKQNTVDLSGLPSGIYILKTIGSDKVNQYKVVKN